MRSAIGCKPCHCGDEPNYARKWAFLSPTGKPSEDPLTRRCTRLGFSFREPTVIHVSSLSSGAKCLEATKNGYI